METLLKKLQEIKELVKAQDIQPVKSPKPPAVEAPAAPEIAKPGAPTSKKDPMKVAAQLKDPDIKSQAVKEAKQLKEGVSFNKCGQWSLKDK